MIAAGAVIGLALAAAVSRLLTTMLFGVEPLDPATFALVALDRTRRSDRRDRARAHA